MKNQFVYLSDKPTAIQHGYEVTEFALVAEKPLISARLEDCAEFFAAHDHFLIATDGDIWFPILKNRLEGAGYRATLLREDGYNYIYDMQRTDPPGKLKQNKINR
jgi:hypothetical protein